MTFSFFRSSGSKTCSKKDLRRRIRKEEALIAGDAFLVYIETLKHRLVRSFWLIWGIFVHLVFVQRSSIRFLDQLNVTSTDIKTSFAESERVLKRLARYLKVRKNLFLVFYFCAKNGFQECDGKECVKKVKRERREQADVISKLASKAQSYAVDSLTSNIRYRKRIWRVGGLF
jgi:hypothetical protein